VLYNFGCIADKDGKPGGVLLLCGTVPDSHQQAGHRPSSAHVPQHRAALRHDCVGTDHRVDGGAVPVAGRVPRLVMSDSDETIYIKEVDRSHFFKCILCNRLVDLKGFSELVFRTNSAYCLSPVALTFHMFL
jgi:hypothetical protein